MNNQVSIIINGVRYDATDIKEHLRVIDDSCRNCDLYEWCGDCDFEFACSAIYDRNTIFKKSDKKFEP